MSLDVWLTVKGVRTPPRQRIYIREEGQNREITRAEWDARSLGRGPITIESEDEGDVYWANITHNLSGMAREAGVYEVLWKPDENGIKKASQLIGPLLDGLELLKSDPERFKEFNPKNGWGTYGGLVTFIRDYLKACQEYPDADVSASR